MKTNAPEGTKTTSASHEIQQVQSPEEWRAALKSFMAPHVLQSWAWGAFKSRWGWSAQRLLLHGENGSREPLAAASVLKRRIPRTPYSILYVPRGPIFDSRDPVHLRSIFSQLQELARREKALFIKVDPEIVLARDIEPESPEPAGQAVTTALTELGWRFSSDQIQFRNTVLLDLSRTEETLLSAMKQKTRYNIRLAGRKNVTVRRGSSSDFDLIAQMYQETAGRDAFAIRPLEYYLDAWQTLFDASLAVPLIAEYDGEPLGAIIIVKSGDRAIYMYGASRNIERKRMPNHLLQWEAIRWAKNEGCVTYDLWGAPDEFVESDRMWGVWRFKDGFSGQVVKHVGAWDYPARPLLYRLYTTLIPRYIAFLRSRRGS